MCEKEGWKRTIFFWKIQVIGHQKRAKGAKRHNNLCPPHEKIVATPMVDKFFYAGKFRSSIQAEV